MILVNADTFLDKAKKEKLDHNDYLYKESNYSSYARALESLLLVGESLESIEVDGSFYIGKDFAVNIEINKLFLLNSHSFKMAVAKYNYNYDIVDLSLLLFTEYFIHILVIILGLVIVSDILV